MSRIVILDSGPLGVLSHPSQLSPLHRWMENLIDSEIVIAIAEIVDYEVRRELIRARKPRGIQRLDQLKSSSYYIPLTTEAMLQAAEFWAEARQKGRPTAGSGELDGDVILAAQAKMVAAEGHEVIIATENVAHLSRFADARRWSDIPVE